MAKEKATFGTCATCVVKYVIVKILPNHKVMFVTDVETVPHKYVHWDFEKTAKFFDSKSYAEDICFGLNVNGYPTFVMEVPDYFNEGDFKNPKEPKSKKKE